MGHGIGSLTPGGCLGKEVTKRGKVVLGEWWGGRWNILKPENPWINIHRMNATIPPGKKKNLHGTSDEGERGVFGFPLVNPEECW